MNNPKMFQVQFSINNDEVDFALHALVKPTEHPQKFHVLRVQSINPRENASVIDDFYIAKVIQGNAPVWVHAGSDISSGLIRAIGNALDKRNTSLLS